MTASDAMLHAIQMHEMIDKTEITEEEIIFMHKMVEEQRQVIEKVWFAIIGVDNSIKNNAEKLGKDDSLIKILEVVRDQFSKAIGEPTYFEPSKYKFFKN